MFLKPPHEEQYLMHAKESNDFSSNSRQEKIRGLQSKPQFRLYVSSVMWLSHINEKRKDRLTCQMTV